MQINENSLIKVLNYIKRLESFPNVCIAFRKEFFKIKINKILFKINFMSQERLSELAILSIENEMLTEFECENLINNFASQQTRKINFN